MPARRAKKTVDARPAALTGAERALDVQSLLAAIVESSDDAIVSKTLEGQILSWNAGAARLFGYSPEEAIGNSIMMIIPPERHHEEHEILARLRAGERIDHYETVRMTKDSRRIDISLTVSPVRDSEGKIVGASKVARDISARKAGEQQVFGLQRELVEQLDDLRQLHEMSLRLSKTLELKPILEETLRTAVAVEGTDLGLVSLCEPDQDQFEVGASQGFSSEFLAEVDRIPPAGTARGITFQERRRVVVEDMETDPQFSQFAKVSRRAGVRAVHSTPLITRLGKIVGVLSTYFREPHRPTDREIQFIDLCARRRRTSSKTLGFTPSSARPTGARTSSSPRWLTSCATRSRRCATRCTSCTFRHRPVAN